MPTGNFTRRSFGPRIEDWDRAYSNRLAIPDAAEWLGQATTRSSEFHRRVENRSETDLRYGEGIRQTYDVYRPEGPPQGTLVFIHGGYWRATSKEDHRVFVSGALALGWRVVLLEYPLCPSVRVGDISRFIVQAIDHVVGQIPDGPVVLSGHSAGGQLATYAMSAGSGLSERARARIVRVVSLSGVHDLRPLLGTTELNGVLGIDEPEAVEFSPVLRRPSHGFTLFCVCGAEELPEFRRQNEVLANLWTGLGVVADAIECAGCNHFTLLDLMVDPDDPLTRLLTAQADP